MMNEVWVCFEGSVPEFFDSEETAKIAYEMYCKQYKLFYSEKIFEMCYKPLSKSATIWTKDTICDYEP